MRVTDLSGAELDYWVAKAEQWNNPVVVEWVSGGLFSPSSDWSIGGILIEREKIALNIHADGTEWYAWLPMPGINRKTLPKGYNGPTPLVAAMRAYVASKFGDEVGE